MVEVARRNRRELKPWQEEGVVSNLPRRHAALFMEMRLGKTLTTIRLAERWTPTVSRAVVAAPSLVLRSWEKELRLEGFQPVRLQMGDRVKRFEALGQIFEHHDGQQWLLITYETMLSTPAIMELPWDLVVLDESRKIQNPKSVISKAVVNLFREVPHRMILCGFPAPESYLELFQPMKFLQGQFMGFKNFYSFRDKYYTVDAWGYNWSPNPSTLNDIRRHLKWDTFVKTAADCGIHYDVTYRRVPVRMTPPQAKLYRKIMDDWETDSQETKFATTKALWLARVAGGFSPEKALISCSKSNAVMGELESPKYRDKQVVIWFRFASELKHMETELDSSKVTHASIFGEKKYDERDDALDRFMAGDARILLATEACAQYGVDCSATPFAWYFSNEYSNDKRRQSEFRIRTIHDMQPYEYTDFETIGTLDEEVIPLLQEKRLESEVLLNNIKERLKWKQK